MDDTDFETFDRAFRRMGSVFRLRLKESDLKELVQTYFRVLNGARLDAVLAAGKVCLANCKTFPKPAEWLDAIAKPFNPSTPTMLPTMGVEEAAEWSRAERLHWEDAPCACDACVAAGISDRPLRFVPQFTAEDGEDRAVHPVKQRAVTMGHWAHGVELARWYVAREKFYALSRTRGQARVAALVGADREPGEEG